MIEISIQLFYCATNHLTVQLLHFSSELLSLSLHHLGLSGVGEWSERVKENKKVNGHYTLYIKRGEECSPERIQIKNL